MRASSVENLQSMVVPAWFRSASEAAISPLRVSSSAIRRRRTRLAKTLNSISAMLSQLADGPERPPPQQADLAETFRQVMREEEAARVAWPPISVSDRPIPSKSTVRLGIRSKQDSELFPVSGRRSALGWTSTPSAAAGPTAPEPGPKHLFQLFIATPPPAEEHARIRECAGTAGPFFPITPWPGRAFPNSPASQLIP